MCHPLHAQAQAGTIDPLPALQDHGLVLRRTRDHQGAAGAQQGSCELRDDGRTGKAAHHDHVDRSPPARIAAEYLRALTHHLSVPGQRQLRERPREMRGPSRTCLHENDLPVDDARRKDESRETAAAPEVDHRRPRGREPAHLRDERARMTKVVVERTTADESQLLGAGQQTTELPVGDPAPRLRFRRLGSRQPPLSRAATMRRTTLRGGHLT